MKSISALELSKTNNQDKFIIDLRTRKEYKTGHIPGSFNIPYEELNNCLHYLNHRYTYYLVCSHGSNSFKASIMLEKLGFSVVNVMGGMSMWRGDIV